jgi:hypothetical protein
MIRINLNGYWVATVTEGRGRIGALVSGSTVTLTPATTAQIQSVIQARTTSAPMTNPRKPKNHESRKTKPGTITKNWLAIQGAREQQVEWIKFGQELERYKMVHVVTDGGSTKPRICRMGRVDETKRQVCDQLVALRYGYEQCNGNFGGDGGVSEHSGRDACMDHDGFSIRQEWSYTVGFNVASERLEKLWRSASGKQVVVGPVNRSSREDEKG